MKYFGEGGGAKGGEDLRFGRSFLGVRLQWVASGILSRMQWSSSRAGAGGGGCVARLVVSCVRVVVS